MKDDLISRQAAIENSFEVYTKEYGWCEVVGVDAINSLPSAQLERETTTGSIGRTRGSITMWYECDACGEPVDKEDAFCRRCGRRLNHE